MAFPDATAKPNARPLCTGDKALPNDASINLSKDLKRINVVACRYYAPSKITNINGSAFLYEAAPDFANVGGYETTFYFTPITAPEQIRQRLYLITIKPSSDHHQTIFEALTTKYGPPDSSQQSQIHNRMGAQFTDATAIWTSGETTLFFKRYNEDVRQAIVMFYHTIGSDYVNAAIRALANENAKKL